MSMIVAHNMSAINTKRQFGTSARGMASAMEKLSSGYKINAGKDDPSGLVISEKLRSQISGLQRAQQNTEEAINVMGIAEGALNEMNSILKKMKALAIHSSNTGVTSPDQIAADQAEMDSSIQTLDRIAKTTNFSGDKLLNGAKDIVFDQDTLTKGTQQNSLLDANSSTFTQIFKRDAFSVAINFTGSTDAPTRTGTGTVDFSQQAMKAYFEVDTSSDPANRAQIKDGRFTQNQSFTLTGNKGTRAFNFKVGDSVADMVNQIKSAADTTGIDAALVFNSEQEIAKLTNGASVDTAVKATVNVGFKDENGDAINIDIVGNPSDKFVDDLDLSFGVELDESGNIKNYTITMRDEYTENKTMAWDGKTSVDLGKLFGRDDLKNIVVQGLDKDIDLGQTFPDALSATGSPAVAASGNNYLGAGTGVAELDVSGMSNEAATALKSAGVERLEMTVTGDAANPTYTLRGLDKAGAAVDGVSASFTEADLQALAGNHGVFIAGDNFTVNDLATALENMTNPPSAETLKYFEGIALDGAVNGTAGTNANEKFGSDLTYAVNPNADLTSDAITLSPEVFKTEEDKADTSGSKVMDAIEFTFDGLKNDRGDDMKARFSSRDETSYNALREALAAYGKNTGLEFDIALNADSDVDNPTYTISAKAGRDSVVLSSAWNGNDDLDLSTLSVPRGATEEQTNLINALKGMGGMEFTGKIDESNFGGVALSNITSSMGEVTLTDSLYAKGSGALSVELDPTALQDLYDELETAVGSVTSGPAYDRLMAFNQAVRDGDLSIEYSTTGDHTNFNLSLRLTDSQGNIFSQTTVAHADLGLAADGTTGAGGTVLGGSAGAFAGATVRVTDTKGAYDDGVVGTLNEASGGKNISSGISYTQQLGSAAPITSTALANTAIGDVDDGDAYTAPTYATTMAAKGGGTLTFTLGQTGIPALRAREALETALTQLSATSSAANTLNIGVRANNDGSVDPNGNVTGMTYTVYAALAGGGETAEIDLMTNWDGKSDITFASIPDSAIGMPSGGNYTNITDAGLKGVRDALQSVGSISTGGAEIDGNAVFGPDTTNFAITKTDTTLSNAVSNVFTNASGDEFGNVDLSDLSGANLENLAALITNAADQASFLKDLHEGKLDIKTTVQDAGGGNYSVAVEFSSAVGGEGKNYNQARLSATIPQGNVTEGRQFALNNSAAADSGIKLSFNNLTDAISGLRSPLTDGTQAIQGDVGYAMMAAGVTATTAKATTALDTDAGDTAINNTAVTFAATAGTFKDAANAAHDGLTFVGSSTTFESRFNLQQALANFSGGAQTLGLEFVGGGTADAPEITVRGLLANGEYIELATGWDGKSAIDLSNAEYKGSAAGAVKASIDDVVEALKGLGSLRPTDGGGSTFATVDWANTLGVAPGGTTFSGLGSRTEVKLTDNLYAATGNGTGGTLSATASDALMKSIYDAISAHGVGAPTQVVGTPTNSTVRTGTTAAHNQAEFLRLAQAGGLQLEYEVVTAGNSGEHDDITEIIVRVTDGGYNAGDGVSFGEVRFNAADLASMTDGETPARGITKGGMTLKVTDSAKQYSDGVAGTVETASDTKYYDQVTADTSFRSPGNTFNSPASDFRIPTTSTAINTPFVSGNAIGLISTEEVAVAAKKITGGIASGDDPFSAARSNGDIAVFNNTTQAGTGEVIKGVAGVSISEAGAQSILYGGNIDGQGRIFVKFIDDNKFELYKDSSMSAESKVASGISGQEVTEFNNSGLTGFTLDLKGTGLSSKNGVYLSLAGIEGQSGIRYDGDVVNTAKAVTDKDGKAILDGDGNPVTTFEGAARFDADKTLVTGVELGQNTSSDGVIYMQNSYKIDDDGNATMQVSAYKDKNMRAEDLVAQSQVYNVGKFEKDADGKWQPVGGFDATSLTVVLNEKRNSDDTEGTGLGIVLSVDASAFKGQTESTTLEGNMSFTNLGARIYSQDYGSDAFVKITQSKGAIFNYYDRAGDASSKRLVDAGKNGTTFQLNGQDATVSINGMQVRTSGLKLNVANQDIQAALTFNQGAVGSTTIAQVGYDIGSIFTRIGALNYGSAEADEEGMSGLLCNAGHVTQERIGNFQGGMQLQLGEGPGDQDRTVVAMKSLTSDNLGRITRAGAWEVGSPVISERTFSMQDVAGGGLADLKSDPILAMSIIEQAINDVTEMRATIGAFQTNLLQTNSNNLSVTIENVTKTESGIRDADMADEMAEFTKQQVLQNAAMSMLGQANQASQNVLQLLR